MHISNVDIYVFGEGTIRLLYIHAMQWLRYSKKQKKLNIMQCIMIPNRCNASG